jgi:maltooligosyltrehalose trehalohydrolase
MPVGAEVVDRNHSHVRVWATKARRVEVVREGGESTPLDAEDGGYFSGVVPMGAGARYRFRLDGGEALFPDPASRFQPDGPHGPSEVIDPSIFKWSDDGWRGARLAGQVVYEMHIGTFTRAGTWASAIPELPELARIGVTMLEVMPVADFAGGRGWGYDGVNKFAPSRIYGTPDDFRRFVDRAHALGLAVILDVVYNHFGPAGNYVREFSPGYFTDKYENDWGESINFDGEGAGPVREFFVTNAGYWIDEFHLDGLRLDATQSIFDESREHVLADIGRSARQAARGRDVVLIAENEPQETRLVRPIADGGYGLDALWNDDFHHSAIVALTGRSEAYYRDTRGTPQELISALKYGYLFQGQYYSWQRQPRGTPTWGIPPAAFVTFLENHDQVANTAGGMRAHQLTSPGRWRAMTALVLLAPATPMLFQGQEFSASAPFFYFVDFDDELNAAVQRGRAEFLKQFPSQRDAQRNGGMADPGSAETFEACKLDFRERVSHAGSYALHQDLLRLRRETAAFRLQRPGALDGSVLSSQALALRFFTDDHVDDRLLIVNWGSDLDSPSVAEPLIAPPAGAEWHIEWSSEALRYGGRGVPPLQRNGRWTIPGESAVVLKPVTSGKPIGSGRHIRRGARRK